jgi:amino acid transporter
MSAPTAPEAAQLRRTLGLPSVLLFGLAYMAPMIVYGTYGVLATASHGTVALAYLLALGAVIFTAMSWLIGAAYLTSAFPGVPAWSWVLGFIVLTTIINVVGIQLASRFNIVLMIVQFVIVAAFIALCVRYVLAAQGPGGLWSVAPFFNADVPFAVTMSGAAIAAYSYLGFDAVSTLTEEAIEPRKTIPRAIVLVALVGGGVFVLAAYFTQIAHPSMAFANVDAAAFEIAKTIGGDVFVMLFLAGLILAQFASGISAQASVGRLLYAMGRDEVLPRRVFGFIHARFRTPALNIVLAGVIGLLALELDVATSTSFINFGAFLAFTAVNLAVIRQHWLARAQGVRSHVIPGVLFPLLGAVGDVWLMCSLDRHALILGGCWFVLGLLYLGYLTRGFRMAPPEMQME